MPPDSSHLFDRPIIILAAPRSGSTLLFETLAEAPELWTLGGESHQVIEGLPELSPVSGRVDSNRLTAEHAPEPIVQAMRRRFARRLRNREGRELFQGSDYPRLRFLEKTPKNALRVPFMERIFPGALYVWLFRDVRANLSSMLEAWRSGRWVTYPRLRGWQGLPWSLLLPPGWQALNGRPLEEVCAFQWASAHRTILSDLAQLPSERWIAVDYQSLLDEPREAVARVCAFAGLRWDERLEARLAKPLPLSRFTHTKPEPDKWRRNAAQIEPVLDSLAELESLLQPVGYRRSS